MNNLYITLFFKFFINLISFNLILNFFNIQSVVLNNIIFYENE